MSDFTDFLTHGFDGREDETHTEVLPDGRIDHADVLIGDSLMMTSEGSEPSPAVAFVFVPKRLEPIVQRQGDRVGGSTDPWHNRWWVATPVAT